MRNNSKKEATIEFNIGWGQVDAGIEVKSLTFVIFCSGIRVCTKSGCNGIQFLVSLPFKSSISSPYYQEMTATYVRKTPPCLQLSEMSGWE
ncbi:hypothetical protein ACTXT7_003066 [Hymenolepis weldensis]